MPVPGRRISRLSGFAPDVPTPFDEDGAVDRAAFERVCDWQIYEGATALIVCGTTGEAPTLSRTEHGQIVRMAIDVARCRVPVIAAASSNSTSQAIELAKDAEAAGADAVLSIVPYYNKPLQAGMYAHFRAIAGSTGLPIILYDVPSRTVCGLADATVARLAESPQFVGLMDATGDMTRPLRLRELLGPDFKLLSGDDATALGFMAQGGNGCISVTSNIVPGLCRDVYWALKEGGMSEAQRDAAIFMKLTLALAAETNPAPVKYALSLMNIMSPRVRLPLVEMNNASKAEVEAALQVLPSRRGYAVCCDNFV